MVAVLRAFEAEGAADQFKRLGSQVVEGAKKAWLDSRTVGRSTDGALLNLLASHEQINRPLQWDADLESKIRALTAEQVNAAFRRHIDPASPRETRRRRWSAPR